MKDNNVDRSIHPSNPSATSLKRYKAPSLTSYGDISVLTKANAPNTRKTDALWPAGAEPNKSS